jgi:hypothetical protein
MMKNPTPMRIPKPKQYDIASAGPMGIPSNNRKHTHTEQNVVKKIQITSPTAGPYSRASSPRSRSDATPALLRSRPTKLSGTSNCVDSLHTSHTLDPFVRNHFSAHVSWT